MLKLIDLDSVFSPEVKFQNWTFPGGEQGIKLPPDIKIEEVGILWHYENDSELFQIGLLVDALSNIGVKSDHIDLMVPYLPYARQDRACHSGESFSLKVLAKFINSLKLRSVIFHDQHSAVASELINRAENVPQSHCLLMSVNVDPFEYVISPDAGAAKKELPIGDFERVTLSKVREGSKVIYRQTIPGLLSGKALVVDDICDGGATFIALAESVLASNPDLELSLYVTHGIFSKGVEELQKYYKNISCFTLRNPSVSDKVQYRFNPFEKG